MSSSSIVEAIAPAEIYLQARFNSSVFSVKKRSKTSTKKKRSGRLSAKQVKAAGLIANGYKLIVVAQRCEVDDSTLRRWRDSALFMAKIREFQRVQEFEIKHELKHTATDLMTGLAAAVRTATGIMNDDDAKDSDRLSAARLAFEMAYKMLPGMDDGIEPTAEEASEADFTEEGLTRVRERIYGIYDD